MIRILTIVLVLALATACSVEPRAEVAMAPLFGDDMVLQRDVVVPVWGTTHPGSQVTLCIAGQTATSHADVQGEWRVDLAPMPAGGPHDLVVSSGSSSLRLENVMVGDVWVCSGQSNMEWKVADSMNASAEIEAANDCGIRHFEVPKSWADKPSDVLAGGAWQVADREHVGSFTGVGYFFARSLRRHVDIPIGLLHASWGGSRIEPWMSAEVLGLDESDRAAIVAGERAREQAILDDLRARIGELPTADEGLVDDVAIWANPAMDDRDWFDIQVGRVWEEQGWEGMDGVAWYRTTFELTAEEAGKAARLVLGTIDDSDIAWVNGIEVGRTELAWNQGRGYHVPAAALREGRNVIAVRVEDTGGGGGLYGGAESRFVEIGGERRPLPSQWRFQIGHVSMGSDYGKNQIPTVLYNKMIHPLVDFPVAGFLWYQGESNAGEEDAYHYRALFARLIRQWRADWQRDEAPFLWVQLAAFMPSSDDPGDSSWAVLRESQATALELNDTAQVVAIDLGEADDIHPRNKQEVGRRLALAARSVAYGEDIVYSGPVYREQQVRGRRIVLEFDHIGEGLVADGRVDGRLFRFAIAGEDRRFRWAHAVIDADRVIVWNDEVKEPLAVRYAWADNPEGANLFNAAGLPAAPFRTDDW